MFEEKFEVSDVWHKISNLQSAKTFQVFFKMACVSNKASDITVNLNIKDITPASINLVIATLKQSLLPIFLCLLLGRPGYYLRKEKNAQIFLAEVLKLKTLIALDLTGCHISAQGAQLLAKYLLKNKKLRHLDISNNKLGKGTRDICQSLLAHPAINFTDFSSNGIVQNQDANALLTLIKQSSRITTLWLGNNPRMSGQLFDKVSHYVKRNQDIYRYRYQRTLSNYIADNVALIVIGYLQKERPTDFAKQSTALIKKKYGEIEPYPSYMSQKSLCFIL
ncbi:MAG: hypothetical protein JKY13_01120 [Gammaproteobacteria bacterium]|nr:hypothetical protein [Gammaproteobacteria bacterium]